MANGKVIPVNFREPLDPLDRAALSIQLRIIRLNREADRLDADLDTLLASMKPERAQALRRAAGN